MANPMIMLKNKVQAQKDELERMREELESKCKEVDEERAVKSGIELEITSISRRLRLIESEYGHAQSRLDDSERKLEAMLESAEESENCRRAFESQISMKDDRSVDLDHLVKEAREAANEAERKLCEASRKLKMLSGDLERAEERADAAELKAQTMEEDLTEMTNILKNKQLSEGQSSERGDVYESTVREMAAQLKEVENKTFENERSCIKLQREVKRLEDEIAHAERVKEGIKLEMESYFQEVETL